MPKKITSLQNDRIKFIAHLRQRRVRDKEGLTIVEGTREVRRALEAGVEFKEIYLCPALFEKKDGRDLLEAFRKNKTSVFEVSEKVYAKIGYGDRNDGLLAVGRVPQTSLSALKAVKSPLYVVVESVEKPGNLGAILRTCDAAGVSGVILCEPRGDLYNPNVIRASLGAVFTVPAAMASNEEVLSFLKERDVTICAALPQAKTVYTGQDMSGPLAIVMGSEQEGLSAFWQKHAQNKLRIPMRGKVDSLNVSASAAVLLYEALRQRG